MCGTLPGSDLHTSGKWAAHFREATCTLPGSVPHTSGKRPAHFREVCCTVPEVCRTVPEVCCTVPEVCRTSGKRVGRFPELWNCAAAHFFPELPLLCAAHFSRLPGTVQVASRKCAAHGHMMVCCRTKMWDGGSGTYNTFFSSYEIATRQLKA